MGRKLNIDEKYVISEYLNGKSSLVLVKEMGVSKPVILNILNKHNIVRKRDRCDSLNIEKWDNGEMEFLRKIFSDTMKKNRKLRKIKSVIRSKKEKEIIKEIKNLGHNVKHSLRIETKICDIYIPKLNLIIEYNGDYWHCNPKKYKPDYYHQVKKKTAKELWEYDKNKIDLILKNGYNLEVVWESDLKSEPNLIKKIITNYDRRE